MAKHTCCVSDTWFISLDEKEIEDTLGMRLNHNCTVETVYHTMSLVIIKLFSCSTHLTRTVAAVKRLPALHYSVDFFLVLWVHGFHCGTLKLLEGH